MVPRWIKVLHIITVSIAIALFLWWLVADEGELFTITFFLIPFVMIGERIIMAGWYYYDIRKVFGKSRMTSIGVALDYVMTDHISAHAILYFREREEFVLNKKP